MSEPEFKAAVGLSRKWDAREAGREVAIDTLNKLGKDVKPDFFLLFSTIHYEKHGGFQKFLDGVWEILPEGTPLIGGTVAGFINPQGCYTRGCTALAVNYPNMDVAVGVGHNTKRNPKKAAKECAEIIKKRLVNSRYNCGYIISLISGSTVPQIPGVGRKRIIEGITGEVAERLTDLSLITLQKGVDRMDEIIKNLTAYMPEYNMMFGASMDDMWMTSNYQFVGNKAVTNIIASLCIKTDLKMKVLREHNLQKNIEFRVTRLSKNKRTIREINGRPAVKEFLDLLGWPHDYLDERVYRKTLFYPIGFEVGGDIIPEVLGLVLGNSILFTYQIPTDNLWILYSSGSRMLSCVDNCIDKVKDKKPVCGIISTCGARLQGLGSHIYDVHRKLKEYFKESAFVAFYVGGEGIYEPDTGLKYGNETFNMSTFWK